jgi:hypothetical protein
MFILLSRGESVEAIQRAMLPPPASTTASTELFPALHIVLLDNIDVAFQKTSDSLTATILTSCLLNAIDTLRVQTAPRGLIVASCTDTTNIPESLFRLARFGHPVTICFPSQESRTILTSQVLHSLPLPVLNRLLDFVAESTLYSPSLSVNNLASSDPGTISNSGVLCEILATEVARRTQVRFDHYVDGLFILC